MNNEIEKKYRIDDAKAFMKMKNNPLINNNYEFDLLQTAKVLDVYYDTKELFLKNAGVYIRTRTIDKNKIISIKTNVKVNETKFGSYTTCDEFTYKISANDSIFNHIDIITKNIPFSIYANLKIDLSTVLSNMRPFMAIETKSSKFHVFSNTLKCELYFTELKYINQINLKKKKDCYIEVQMSKNEAFMEKFFEFNNRIQKSVKPIFECKETKFDMALEITK